jgi:hypothetical protein
LTDTPSVDPEGWGHIRQIIFKKIRHLIFKMTVRRFVRSHAALRDNPVYRLEWSRRATVMPPS